MKSRGVVAIILGYLCLFTVAFSAQTVVYIVIGPDRVFQSQSFEITSIWIVVALVSGLVGAMFGGYICRFTAGSAKPAFYLAALIVLIAFAVGGYSLVNPAASVLRQGDVKMLNAMNVAISPKWLVFVHGLVCSIGVLAGAGMIKTRATITKENNRVLKTGI